MGWNYIDCFWRSELKIKNKQSKPPGIAKWILEHSASLVDRYSLVDDLREEYEEKLKDTAKIVCLCWYWIQVFRTIPSLFFHTFYWSFIMFINYCKISIRNIKKHKVYSFINIAGLAVGMACALLVFAWVQSEVSYDKFHKNRDRLFRVAFSTDKQILFANSFFGEYLPGLSADYLKDNYPDIEAATIVGGTNSKLSVGEKSFTSYGSFVHPSFFEMFSFPFVKGDSKSAFSSPVSIVISEELAKRLFGKKKALGATI